MLVILREMVDDTALARMQVAAPQILRADLFARRRLHQRRSAEEDRALVADDHALVAHRRDVGATSGAAAHHAGDLRDALRAHLRLVEEDAAEMVAVREHIGLMREVGSAAVHEIDAGKPVLLGDLLRSEMLLHRNWIVGPALHRRVIADDHHLLARHPADARDHSGAGHLALVHVAGGELADFEERRTRIEQALNAIAREKLAALEMTLPMLFRPAPCRFGDIGAQFFRELPVILGPLSELFVVRNDFALDARRAHAPRSSIGRNYLPLA